MFIAGIDGGGTGTRLELRRGDNTFIGRAEFGPFNIAAIGEERFTERLRGIFSYCGEMSECAALCIGGAGVSVGAMADITHRELERRGFRGVLTLCGDHEIALRGALSGPGGILIAGTGSICCGRNPAGEFVRCGGWGHIIDDAGSGYAIGRGALAEAVRAEDGRSPGSALHREVMEKLGAKDAGGIVEFVYHSGAGKAGIAALAGLVLDCAAAGDIRSLDILDREADELAALVRALAAGMKTGRPRLALLGGLLTGKNVYADIVRSKLESLAELTEPEHDALWGAAQLAFDSLNTVQHGTAVP